MPHEFAREPVALVIGELRVRGPPQPPADDEVAAVGGVCVGLHETLLPECVAVAARDHVECPRRFAAPLDVDR